VRAPGRRGGNGIPLAKAVADAEQAKLQQEQAGLAAAEQALADAQKAAQDAAAAATAADADVASAEAAQAALDAQTAAFGSAAWSRLTPTTRSVSRSSSSRSRPSAAIACRNTPVFFQGVRLTSSSVPRGRARSCYRCG
jgi:multidrug efflux pump subunit AcrA (membrane-fusion protein)